MRVELAPHEPSFVALAMDSLGQKKLNASPLKPPIWTFEFSKKEIPLTSLYSAQNPPPFRCNLEPFHK
jgi:hypothetical protein